MFQSKVHFKKFISLSLQQRRYFCMALLQLSVVKLKIRCRSIDWFWQKLEIGNQVIYQQKETSKERIENISIAQDLHELIRLASRLLPFACECIPRSIVLRDMLQKIDIDAKVKIGVKKSAINLQSHAWVEVYDQAIGEITDLKKEFRRIDVK